MQGGVSEDGESLLGRIGDIRAVPRFRQRPSVEQRKRDSHGEE